MAVSSISAGRMVGEAKAPGGAPNIVCFIDREKDLCGFMGVKN